MKTVEVRVKVSVDGEGLDVSQITSTRRDVAMLISSENSVLVFVDSDDTCGEHLEVAKHYSHDLASLNSEIGRINAMLLISALRSKGIPTHNFPLESASKARKVLQRIMEPTAVVVF